MYLPQLGRFVQTDPIGYGDGMNMYAYVRNGPISRKDSWGISSQDNPDLHSGFEFDGIVVTGDPCRWDVYNPNECASMLLWDHFRNLVQDWNNYIHNVTSDVICEMSPVSIDFSVDFYKVLGGSYRGTIEVNPLTGQIGAKFRVGVGVGFGGKVGIARSLAVGAPVIGGPSGSVLIGGFSIQANGQLGPVGSTLDYAVGTESGLSAGPSVGGVGNTFNVNLGGEGGFNTPAIYNARC